MRSLRERPRELRKTATEAESVLWHFLRDRKLNGLKFRRQHRIKRIILDFYCAEKKLGIEVDGNIHAKPEQQDRDRERSAELERAGIRIIRFNNSEVMNDIDSVLKNIKAAASASLSPKTCAQPFR